MKKSRYEYPVPEHQARSVMVMANPISGTLYEWDSAGGVVNPLGPQRNVRILEIAVNCTWTVQPTPIQVHLQIDGRTYIFSLTDPVSTQNYIPYLSAIFADNAQELIITSSTESTRKGQPFIEGRSVRIWFEITGGTVSELEGQVLWSRF